MSKKNDTRTIEVPQRMLISMVKAYQKWEEFSDEFEDFAFSSDEQFIKNVRKARKEHLKGKTRALKLIKAEIRQSHPNYVPSRNYTNI